LKVGLLEANNEALRKRIISDYKRQFSAIEGMTLAMGDKFVDPRDYKAIMGLKENSCRSKKRDNATYPRTCRRSRTYFSRMMLSNLTFKIKEGWTKGLKKETI
jgi:hypothetical protein